MSQRSRGTVAGGRQRELEGLRGEGPDMKAIARSLVVVLVALVSVPALVVTATITTAVQLLATTALIMGGTQHPLSPPTDDSIFVNQYFGQAVNNYIIPGSNPAAPIDTYAVIYPAEFAPVFGSTTFDSSVSQGVSNLGACLGVNDGNCTVNHSPGVDSPTDDPPSPADTHFVVFGYSQSAVVVSLVKNQLVDNPSQYSDLNGTEIYLDSNPMRPNGGILGRGFEGMTIPLIGITFYGPTKNSCSANGQTVSCEQDADGFVTPTVDTAQEYDLLGGDAPAVPWNVLAWANSAAAYYYLHGEVPSHSLTEPGVVDQGKYGDTQYYLITSERLPILLPLQQIGVPDALLAVADAPIRVLIESGYYRDTSPGEHVTFQLLPQKDLGTLAVNLAASIPVGIDDGLQEAGLGRALGTNDVYRPFGVGGETYDKTDGTPQGVETGGNVFSDPVQQSQTLSIASDQPGDTGEQSKTEKTLKPLQLGNLGNNAVASNDDTSTTQTPLDGNLPNPLKVIRESLKFDPPKPLASLRPSGDGPLKKLVGALTGQRPKEESTGDDAAA
ncbi:PE-PPE domain-containing protein [Mycolicibacterium moriokaense]|nr:PE-PPE domain-containing protein [Mycolicibacterium moriokaense]